jgi:hypothetical protein
MLPYFLVVEFPEKNISRHGLHPDFVTLAPSVPEEMRHLQRSHSDFLWFGRWRLYTQTSSDWMMQMLPSKHLCYHGIPVTSQCLLAQTPLPRAERSPISILKHVGGTNQYRKRENGNLFSRNLQIQLRKLLLAEFYMGSYSTRSTRWDRVRESFIDNIAHVFSYLG